MRVCLDPQANNFFGKEESNTLKAIIRTISMGIEDPSKTYKWIWKNFIKTMIKNINLSLTNRR
jgi:hypothetical protein